MSFLDWFKRKKIEKPVVDPWEILPGNKLLGKLLEVWPNLNPGRLWKADKTYIMPTKEKLDEALFESKVDSYQYIPEIEDCDDFALLLHADIIRRRYDAYKAGKIPKDRSYPWAFGQIWYQSSRGPHAINICITCDKGVLLIEPQQDKIWKPDKDMIIFFIRM